MQQSFKRIMLGFGLSSFLAKVVRTISIYGCLQLWQIQSSRKVSCAQLAPGPDFSPYLLSPTVLSRISFSSAMSRC